MRLLNGSVQLHRARWHMQMTAMRLLIRSWQMPDIRVPMHMDRSRVQPIRLLMLKGRSPLQPRSLRLRSGVLHLQIERMQMHTALLLTPGGAVYAQGELLRPRTWPIRDLAGGRRRDQAKCRSPIEPILPPIRRVVADVMCDAHPFGIVADNVFIVPVLPHLDCRNLHWQGVELRLGAERQRIQHGGRQRVLRARRPQ